MKSLESRDQRNKMCLKWPHAINRPILLFFFKLQKSRTFCPKKSDKGENMVFPPKGDDIITLTHLYVLWMTYPLFAPVCCGGHLCDIDIPYLTLHGRKPDISICK